MDDDVVWGDGDEYLGTLINGKIGLIALKEGNFRKIPLKNVGPVKYHRKYAPSPENNILSRKPSV